MMVFFNDVVCVFGLYEIVEQENSLFFVTVFKESIARIASF